MQPLRASMAVAGNKEVCELLQRWLVRARLGQINFIGLVACESPVLMFNDHVGVAESHFAAAVGLDHLKQRVVDSIVNRQVPDIDHSVPANLVCYDLACEPTNFDFLAWLVNAEMIRRRENAPAPLKVAFMVSRGQEEVPANVEQRTHMLTNVLIPLVELIGGIVSDEALAGRRYTIYTFAEIVRAVKDGERVPLFRPSDFAFKTMAHFTAKHGSVTITLREADHWPHRNSNLEAWLKFAEYLENQGERVIFIRDTAKRNESFCRLTCGPASQHTEMRMALYENAKCNLFVSNGPWSMALFGSKPWLMFNAIDHMDPFMPNTPGWWRKHHGIGEGEQFPWCSPDQRIIWKTDNYENLCQAWNEFQLAQAA